MRKSILFSATLVALLSLPVVATAAPITGFLGIGGGITFDQEWGTGGVGAAILDWNPVGGGTGDAAVVTDATGYFDPLNNFSQLTITDLTNDADLINFYSADGPKFAPPGPAADVPNFLFDFQDPDLPGLHFDLTEVVVQSGTNCADSQVDGCVLGGVFVLTETAEGMRVSLDVLGNFVRGVDFGAYKGAFATTFIGHDFASFFARLDAGLDISCPSSGVANATPCTFDANFNEVTQVPEPATLLLLGTGLLGAGYRQRRKLSKK